MRHKKTKGEEIKGRKVIFPKNIGVKRNVNCELKFAIYYEESTMNSIKLPTFAMLNLDHIPNQKVETPKTLHVCLSKTE